MLGDHQRSLLEGGVKFLRELAANTAPFMDSFYAPHLLHCAGVRWRVHAASAFTICSRVIETPNKTGRSWRLRQDHGPEAYKRCFNNLVTRWSPESVTILAQDFARVQARDLDRPQSLLAADLIGNVGSCLTRRWILRERERERKIFDVAENNKQFYQHLRSCVYVGPAAMRYT